MSSMKHGKRLQDIADRAERLWQEEGPHPRDRVHQQQQIVQQQQANAGEDVPTRPEAKAVGPAQQRMDLTK